MRCALTSDETRLIAAGACLQWEPTSHRVSLTSLIERMLARSALCKSLNTNASTFPDSVVMVQENGDIVITEVDMCAQIIWIMEGKRGLYECHGWITSARVKASGAMMNGNAHSLTVDHLTEADHLYDTTRIEK